ncbi:MAG: GNAT family protein [Patescibacteria group bacterium]|jgi:RimJ/RimL family protein N-acetyltransferase
MQEKKGYLIKGQNLALRKLLLTDVNKVYLSWLNDKSIQKYTRRRGQKMTMLGLKKFVKSIEKSKDWHFAIIIKDSKKHIGNVFLNLVDDLNKSADLSIMIGDKNEWGKGYAGEVIKLATQFAFKELKLHRLSAGSPNPAFNTVVKKLGWTLEGKRRDAFFFERKFIDISCWSILKNEWKNK